MKLACTLLALAALVAAGCGGDDETTTTEPTAGASGEAGASGASGEGGALGGDFEQALKDQIDEGGTVLNPDFTCDDEIPPPDGETVTCDATGENDEGVKGKGEIKLTTNGKTVDYEIALQGGTSSFTSISQIGVDGSESSSSDLLP